MMRASIVWSTGMAVLLSGALAFAQGYGQGAGDENRMPGDDDATSGVGAPPRPSPPGRENERRSGVAGSPDIDRGSGSQGAGTSTGPSGGGLTGNEGQGDEGDDEDY